MCYMCVHQSIKLTIERFNGEQKNSLEAKIQEKARSSQVFFIWALTADVIVVNKIYCK